MAFFTKLLMGLSHLTSSQPCDATSTSIGRWNRMPPAVIDEMSASTPTSSATPNLGLSTVGSPNSVALFLYGPSAYSPEEDGEIFYLPLGQRIYTDDYGALPSRPQYARIVEISVESLTNSPSVECFAYPYAEEEESIFRIQGQSESQVVSEGKAIRFDFDDELVNFVSPTSEWFLNGQQIESYECR